MSATGKGNYRLLWVVYCGPAVVLCLLLLAVSGASGTLHHDSRAHYCGTKLSNTLAELCTSFNGLRKKADSSMMPYGEEDYTGGNRLLDDVQQDVEELRQLHDRSTDTIYRALMSLDSLNSHALGFHRVRRQVVKECCIQSCTIDTLRTYCAD